MVLVKVESLIMGIPPSPSVVVLRPSDEQAGSDKVVPIWIGPTEAAAIGVALENQARPRPMTHDLLVKTLEALGASLKRVAVVRAEGSMFFATLCLDLANKQLDIDARPSDCIALALRTDAPIYMDEDVLNSSSYPYLLGESLESDRAMDDFREFLDSLSPEDFDHH